MNEPPFEYDGPALDNLDEQMIQYKGGIIKLDKPLAFYHPHVLAAIRYLCDEFDYGVEINLSSGKGHLKNAAPYSNPGL